jgi:hypothetical protein
MKARRQEVQTIRHPSSSALLIDSLDRYSTGFPFNVNSLISSSQWTLQKPNYVLNGYFTRVALTQVQFFWNLPTIITGYNDQMQITTDGNTYTITLDQGFYNANQIADAIITELNALGTGTTFTAPAITAPPCSIIINGDDSFTIEQPSHSASRVGRFYQTAGFIPQSSVLVSGVHTIGTPAIATLLPTRFVDITSHYLTKFQRVKDASTLSSGDSQNILSRVYAFSGMSDTTWPPVTTTTLSTSPYTTTWNWDVPAPFVVVQDYTSPKNIAWSPDEAISNFDIVLLDEYGQILPWSPTTGVEYQITLLASET